MNISDHSFDNIIWPKGEHPGWAWSNQVSPLKVAFFFLAGCRRGCQRDALQLAWKKANVHVVNCLRGPHGRGLQVAPGS